MKNDIYLKCNCTYIAQEHNNHILSHWHDCNSGGVQTTYTHPECDLKHFAVVDTNTQHALNLCKLAGWSISRRNWSDLVTPQNAAKKSIKTGE